MLRSVLAPLVSGLTYRRYVHLLLGAVVALPYGALVALFVTAAGQGGLDPVASVVLCVISVVAGIGALLVPGVRALEVTAARALLGADVPDPDPATADAWPARWRAAAWLVVVVLAGSAVALATLVAIPTAVGFAVAPWVLLPGLSDGWSAAWAPFVAVLLVPALLYLVWGVGEGLARLAPRFIGPSPAERLAGELAAARAAAHVLAERNRLARELHDSVGHALTVTTLQAEAAARKLDVDPAFVSRALHAIADAGRSAMADLDHVLGLLRDPAGEPADRAPQPDLADLDALVAGARAAGVPVTAEVDAPPTAVPAGVSREAYRVVQECLTNALRHAGPVPVGVRVAITDDALAVEVTNPLGAGARSRPGGGRGLAGLRERVVLLHGELAAGPDGDTWRVRATLPLTL
ncbi:histidine kinase [Pseudonocardia sp. CA-107938]|uniref:sensor histidine kinase n=1 Tax=Pseudonocardia sp. CA-107938 TaxID=3240021 RepID=UPI003D931BAE